MQKIDPADLSLHPFRLLDKEWALLVAGVEAPNPMTVSWGGFGTLWNLPTVTVYVRPTRHTFSLLVKDAPFTLNVLPEARREALTLCGTRSGRDTDKWQAARLQRATAETVPVPRVDGAVLSIECRVAGFADLDPAQTFDPSVPALYPESDYHRIFLGRVLAVFGEGRFALP